MDKENGKNSENNTGTSKLSNSQDAASLLDAASLFGAYWPRGDSASAANAANLFAAAAAAGAGGFGMPPHPGLPFGMAAAQAAAAAAAAASTGGRTGGGGSASAHQGYPPTSSAQQAQAAAAAQAAYNTAAYSNTLSVAASQAASLGIPAASAAWWSMASHLAAQDYLARLQASGLNFPGLGNPAELQYSALGLPSPLASLHNKSSSSSKGGKGSALSSSLSRSSSNSKSSLTSHSSKSDVNGRSSSDKGSHRPPTSSPQLKYGAPSVPGLTIQPAQAVSVGERQRGQKGGEAAYSPVSSGAAVPQATTPVKSKTNTSNNSSGGTVKVSSPSPSIFTSPLSLASNNSGSERSTPTGGINSTTIASLPSSILSDPNSILGGVRLPPDTEIIKYTSSIVGPKIPGTTNRGRKKTISLDPPSVSLHPSHSSTGLLIERATKRPKLSEQELSPPSTPSSADRVDVIKLPASAANGGGSASPAPPPYPDHLGGGLGEAPLNLSLKPSPASTTSGSGVSSTGGVSSSLASLSNMSASIGSTTTDRISRRKPGPKPRRVPQPQQHHSSAPAATQQLPPSALPSSSLAQLFNAAAAAAAAAESPRPPSRGSDGGSSTSSVSGVGGQQQVTGGAMSSASSGAQPAQAHQQHHHKDGRPRNLGRGVSKPKKNTVASLLAQSRALGIKPVPILDPNVSMAQQMNMLKSNILAAQQYISEAGGDEKALNKFLQEKLRGTLSDSSTVDATSDSDNLTDSNHTDSEMEQDAVAAKKQKQYDERLLRVPLEKGWKRETIIRGLTKNGGIKGDVTYSAPDSTNKFKQMSDVTQYLEYQKSTDLSRDNFTFSCRVILGDYLQLLPVEMQTDGNEFIRLTEEDVFKRLEELKSAMRTSLPLEQRIEMARKQQAARAAARLDREQARITKELERSERQEQARREKEARAQQMLEAKRKRQEEMEKQKHEEQQRKQQERELKRQQAAILKEQMYIQEISKQREMLYTVELERERRRQHMALVKSLESRRKIEERERKKQQLLAEKQANKEKKLEQRKVEMEILAEIRKPVEDLELEQNDLPEYERIPGLKMSGKAFADTLMVFEFLHNFGETLGFDMESLPTLDSLQQAVLSTDHSTEAEEELFSIMTHLLVCAIEDPGIPNPGRYTTILGQSLRQADITPANISEILRIFMYANATGEVKALTGVHFERDREKRIADHHQNDEEMLQTQSGKNAQYYELLHSNHTYKLSDLLKDKPFLALSPTNKAEILAYICNELLQNKAVVRQIESSLESVAHLKKDKWLLDMKIRKLKMLHNRKIRSEAMEKMQNKTDGDTDSVVDSPSLHKDDLLDEEDNDMSENESVGTQPEEEEDNKLSGEELGKKLEKLIKQSEIQLQTLNVSTSQLRATCFGQDRYFRRYWSIPKAGGIFVEAMESADPEELERQQRPHDEEDTNVNGNNPTTTNEKIKCLNDLDTIMQTVEKINDISVDKEVSNIVGTHEADDEEDNKNENDGESEHRKTPNRSEEEEVIQNGEILDKNERNLAELKKSVDDIVQNLERNIELEKEQKIKQHLESSPSTENHINDVSNVSIKRDPDTEPFGSRKFNLFERLGQCMERENKSEEDFKCEVKAEVKEELKNEILNELKSEIKAELKQEHHEEDAEHKWFGILNRDCASCDGGVLLSTGSRWDAPGSGTELRIPVFPPPGANGATMGMSAAAAAMAVAAAASQATCESPAPLQMSAEEGAQLEYIKRHGMPAAGSKKSVPEEMRYGWWRITDIALLSRVLDSLHVRGVRERELKRNIISLMQTMYERQGNLVIEEGNKELTSLVGSTGESQGEEVAVRRVHGAPAPDEPGAWSQTVAQRVDMFLMEQVEALEDKVANASMQVKGWKLPSRDVQEIPYRQIVEAAKDRLSSLEQNIERRYLKPPLGVNTGDPNLVAMAHEAAAAAASTPSAAVSSGGASSVGPSTSPCPTSSGCSTTPAGGPPSPDDLPKGLVVWREALQRCSTSAQLAMCLYSLESSIAWDKSIMKANCQFCHSGDNEDKLLLCDGCDKGYHTYCFKPKMENIPEGDWYCHECMNKATGERNCIVCGRRSSQTGARLVLCDLCPRAYHTDCARPPMQKPPRGKWYCANCFSKKPHRKPTVKKNNQHRTSGGGSAGAPSCSTPVPSKDGGAGGGHLQQQQQPPPPPQQGQHQRSESESGGDQGPSSPAPSHSSFTTNEDQPSICAQSDISNSSLTGSPSTGGCSNAAKKEKAANKRLIKELAPCKALLEDLECHDDAWPFLLPVNTKQFPTYKKIIKVPMDLSTIKKRLQDLYYKSRDEFCADVRQIFNNCETFNEDDSPVGKAGHCMRQFFEARWSEISTVPHS
ncbi:unnamed protein product [Acanthoscelides obtectus]|uniref:Bromodomain adjacent to zinc finger domain protein 2B n=1 Tax=Acanthoscelides obtectus TaxID=200917 RepID=A0A9P0K9D0_ACAOB|nr:unnamed protein product [Acanthoscelides obtectus]CAK1658198.1 Bromodomain adjacent to zinc finger domain protein 2B [Acanthoscelides obtectus]